MISLLIISSLFVACNKKNDAETPIENQIDSTENIKNDLPKKALTELTPTQASQFLKTNNDTLYVTNFFATWCRPCIIEIPHFKEKMQELNGQPVKFTFVNVNRKEEWSEDVEKFVDDFGIRNQTILLDPYGLDENFFKNNFSGWMGDYIPFTILRKGDKIKEVSGTMSKIELDSQIKALQ